jgi:hypothetical protein
VGGGPSKRVAVGVLVAGRAGWVPARRHAACHIGAGSRNDALMGSHRDSGSRGWTGRSRRGSPLELVSAGSRRCSEALTRWWMSVVIGCMALAACGSSTSTSQVRHKHSRVSASAAAAACGRQARLSPGVEVDGWRMGAVHFRVTAAEFPCYVQVRSGGVEVARQSQKVRLAISRNGGRHWLIVGGALPVTPAATGAGGEQVVGTSVRDVWALSSNGHVLVTSNGGGAWIVAPLPRPVVQLAVADRPPCGPSPARTRCGTCAVRYSIGQGRPAGPGHSSQSRSWHPPQTRRSRSRRT